MINPCCKGLEFALTEERAQAVGDTILLYMCECGDTFESFDRTPDLFRDVHKIKYMLNRSHRGKMPKDATRQRWARFNGSFEEVETTPLDMLKNIYQGWAVCNVFSDNRRKKANFVESHFMGFDFDNEDDQSRLSTLFKPGAFSDLFSSFGYTTPSHSEEKPRARVVVIFNEPIKDIDRHEELYIALGWMFKATMDEQCKDALRLFYGSPECKMMGNWSVLTEVAQDTIIEQYKKAHPIIKVDKFLPSKKLADGDSAERMAWAAITSMADNIARAQDGNKHNTRMRNAYACGGHGAGANLSQAEIVDFLTPYAVGNDPTVERSCIADIKSAVESGWSKPVYHDTQEDILI